MPKTKLAMGLDIGGTGIKGAVVDVDRAELVSERVRIKTPQPATPKAVMETAAKVRKKLDWEGPVGCGFPGQIKNGITSDAPNLDPKWTGYNILKGLRSHLGLKEVTALNDADAAGLAEMKFGAGQGRKGTVILLTLGTGIGTAVFRDGLLLPFTELGHLEIGGRDAETVTSERARIVNAWSWKRWAKNLDRYLAHLEYLLAVDLYILGGGGSKKAAKFLPHLELTKTEIVTAKMGNLAGIVGAAMHAVQIEG
jgi:polyphosphate glucokinase